MQIRSIFLVLLFIIPIAGIAQFMEQHRGAKIQLNDNIYDFYESEVFFKKVPIAYQKYQRAEKARKASKVFGYASLAYLGIGLGLVKLAEPENPRSITTGQAIGWISVVIACPITGTIGLLSGATAKAHLRKAVAYYNGNSHLVFVPQEQKVKVSLGSTQNGIGLIVNF